jgi:hypothetical protein
VALTSDVARETGWHPKPVPTFSGALALVRCELWAQAAFCMSTRDPDMVEVPRAFVARLTDALCYAS